MCGFGVQCPFPSRVVLKLALVTCGLVEPRASCLPHRGTSGFGVPRRRAFLPTPGRSGFNLFSPLNFFPTMLHGCQGLVFHFAKLVLKFVHLAKPWCGEHLKSLPFSLGAAEAQVAWLSLVPSGSPGTFQTEEPSLFFHFPHLDTSAFSPACPPAQFSLVAWPQEHTGQPAFAFSGKAGRRQP